MKNVAPCGAPPKKPFIFRPSFNGAAGHRPDRNKPGVVQTFGRFFIASLILSSGYA
jgi:hypothetical protein